MKHTLKPSLLWYALVATCCLLSSCATHKPTREQRITEHRDLYDGLKSKEKIAVNQGKIIEGMSKDGVFLSMGAPSKQVEGFQNGSSFDRWYYGYLRPVYRTGFSTSYGYGRGFGRGFRGGFHGHGYSRRGFHGGFGGFGFSNSVRYVPSVYATVTFKNERVDSWSRKR